MNWVKFFKMLKVENPTAYYDLLLQLIKEEKVRSAQQPTISKGHTSDSHAIKEGDM